MKITENISVIVPAYEPDEKLIFAVDELHKSGFDDIVIVNDGSSRACGEIFAKVKELPYVTYLEHSANRGKGAALRTAFSYIMEFRPNLVGAVTVDSDGQHLTKDVIACVTDMQKGEPHCVLGCRDFTLPDVPARSKKGNEITHNVFKKFFKIDVSDTQTGLRAFPKYYIHDMLDVVGDRYEYENNMLLMFRDRKIPFSEVKIDTVYLEENKSSHFRPVRDSIRIYYHLFEKILKYVLSSFSCVILENVIQTLLHDFVGKTVTAVFWLELLDFLPARIFASVVNYYLNRRFVFKKEKSKSFMRKYFVLWIIQAVATYGLIALLEILFNGTGGILYFIIISIVKTAIFFVSYKVQNKWVFK